MDDPEQTYAVLVMLDIEVRALNHDEAEVIVREKILAPLAGKATVSGIKAYFEVPS